MVNETADATKATEADEAEANVADEAEANEAEGVANEANVAEKANVIEEIDVANEVWCTRGWLKNVSNMTFKDFLRCSIYKHLR